MAEQQRLPGFAPGGKLRRCYDAGGGLYWQPIARPPQTAWQLHDQAGALDVVVRHCGHPTALWPYYAEIGGRMHIAPNGRGFVHADTARRAAVDIYKTEASQ